MNTLTTEQVNTLKPLIAAYRAECEEFEKRQQDFNSVEEFLDIPNQATEALIAKMEEFGLSLNLDVVDEIEAR